MVSFVLNNFIDNLINQDVNNIPPILSICQQTIDRYKGKIENYDKVVTDIKYPLTTLVNINNLDNQLNFHFVEENFEIEDSNTNKVFIQEGYKLREIVTIKNEDSFKICTKNGNFFVQIKDDEVESFKKERKGSPFSIIPNQDFNVGSEDINLVPLTNFSEDQKKNSEYQEIKSNVIELQSIFEWKKLWYPLIPIDCLTNKNFPIKECKICKVKLVSTNMRLRKLISRQMYQGSKDSKNLHYKTDINIGIYFWENITKCQKCNLECQQKGNFEKINESDNGFNSKSSSYNELISLRGNDDNDDLTSFIG